MHLKSNANHSFIRIRNSRLSANFFCFSARKFNYRTKKEVGHQHFAAEGNLEWRILIKTFSRFTILAFEIRKCSHRTCSIWLQLEADGKVFKVFSTSLRQSERFVNHKPRQNQSLTIHSKDFFLSAQRKSFHFSSSLHVVLFASLHLHKLMNFSYSAVTCVRDKSWWTFA